MNYAGYLRLFKDAWGKADVPSNKRRPHNLRHTRLTVVATFKGYEQLNKIAGWVPCTNRANVHVHLINDDVDQAIRDQYGLDGTDSQQQNVDCPFCGSTNQASHSECRNCGRPLSLKQQFQQVEKLSVLERLAELEDRRVLKRLEQLAASTLSERTSEQPKDGVSS